MACRGFLANHFVKGTCSAGKGAIVASVPAITAGRETQASLGSLLFYKRPTVAAATMFLLTLSGPPRIRIRDAEASLRGDVDWVVILHLAVWGAAGLWVLWQVAKRYQAKRPLFRLS